MVHTRKPKFDEKGLGGRLKYKNLNNSVAKITYDCADCTATQFKTGGPTSDLIAAKHHNRRVENTKINKTEICTLKNGIDPN